ncbi:E3 ubiquitin-protein ligase RHF2A isoform X1 [Capsicum annuum]|uniref:E3 ubiquitin-protein ligase RHF2A isoform X1 n=1 Tax=Capsicum annuum TaxID=4072 RepID=UPI0007BF3F59|nr:E3 ubiquitin-protein ligase RHF2A isoform X1 [Capsicum annuum]XP_016545682.1 E3 ubiquitin-protein ligase RHF2A isoform X1 [Capsicum annuum]XP_016545689.1 E3 ubiquitin-protein ligase RHF2A isoform X1 [Capsicum annuum]XP_016545695.1 E3 ubiquitin-protein ligase RHF2A isoform X1 [Capsicum annuum]XP_047250332.1 E3 ubiquitin-protein ligase RHF2A isoform X1 [Capsicum annuum]
MDDELKKAESHTTSAAAFVEGGIQDACDDACSICLEAFCESDPSTLTSCKHEFHLQCILEWHQRSSNCPMCWQPLSLKDPTSQELLEAVEQERTLRFNQARNASVFRRPTLLTTGMSESELEERIIQHLAAAAAMGRGRHFGQREGSRNRSSSHGHPHFLVFSTHPDSSPTAAAVSASVTPAESDSGQAIADPSVPITAVRSEPAHFLPQLSFDQSNQLSASSSRYVHPQTVNEGISVGDRSSSSSSITKNQDTAGPSDFQSLSESWKSRFNSMSMKYRESISRSTRGWKERLFSRSNSMAADIGSEVRREVNAEIANVSRMMERFETRENRTDNNIPDPSNAEQRHNDSMVAHNGSRLNGNNSATFSASSARN